MPQRAQTARRTRERATLSVLSTVRAGGVTTQDIIDAEQRESDAAALAYRVYERLGVDRTIPATVDALRAERPEHYRSTDATLERRLKGWASKYHWRARVRAYDDAQELLVRQEAERARRTMNEAQAGISERLLKRVARRVVDLLSIDQAAINATMTAQELLARGQPVPTHIQKLMATRPALTMGGAVLSQLMRDLVDIERLARGAATEIAQAHEGADERESATTSSESADDAAQQPTLFYFPQPAQPPHEHLLDEPPDEASIVDAD